ncbi:MAG: DHH family phosphoesterase [Oscillospiraceae bacterium]|jgi:phosphoesterase RecJ-like protein
MNSHECAALLREQDNILLITHRRPDGDTLGSAAALCHALRRIGKIAHMFPNPQITENYIQFMKPYLAPEGFVPSYVVAVDTADTGLFPEGFQGNVDLCIDHHPTNTYYAANSFVRPEVASCGELVLEIIKALCGGLDEEEANLTYIAVSTDTGCFCYGNTTSDTHRAAAELIDYGANNKFLNKAIFRTFSAARLALEGMIYTGMTTHRDGKVAIAIVTLDMMEKAGANENDCEDIASLPGKIRGAEVSITIREIPSGPCKVSVRTTGTLDAAKLCAKFGGGGHAMAAGCNMDCTPDEAREILLKAINEEWK